MNHKNESRVVKRVLIDKMLSIKIDITCDQNIKYPKNIVNINLRV